MHTRHLLTLAVALSLVLGCEDAEKEKAKAADLQRKADERISKIEAQTAEKVASAEKRVAELQDQLIEAGAQAKAEADEEVSKLKTEADKLAAEAAAAIKKARAAYKETERNELTSLSKDLDDVRAKAQSAPPKVKTQVDQALKDATAKKDAARKAIDAFDDATVETMKTAKAKADQAMAQLKQAIHTARTKLP